MENDVLDFGFTFSQLVGTSANPNGGIEEEYSCGSF